MGPPPIVNGISPREGPPGTKITIRGENFGVSPQDLVRLYIIIVTGLYQDFKHSDWSLHQWLRLPSHIGVED